MINRFRNTSGYWGNSTAVAILAIVLIVAAIAGSIYWKMAHSTKLGETRKIIAFDEITHQVKEIEIKTDEMPPYFFPGTDERSAYPAIQCTNCGGIYGMKVVPISENECPYCSGKLPRLLPFVPGQQLNTD